LTYISTTDSMALLVTFHAISFENQKRSESVVLTEKGFLQEI